MTITIPSELEVAVRNKAEVEGLSIEAYVERLIREDEQFIEQSEEPLDDKDPEFVEIREAVLEGLEQAERGESRPAEEVFAELRAKYGIPR
jgi:predicted transcriptional regulator